MHEKKKIRRWEDRPIYLLDEEVLDILLRIPENAEFISERISDADVRDLSLVVSSEEPAADEVVVEDTTLEERVKAELVDGVVLAVEVTSLSDNDEVACKEMKLSVVVWDVILLDWSAEETCSVLDACVEETC